MNTKNISHIHPDTSPFARRSGSARIGLLLTCLVLAVSLTVTYQLWQSAQQQSQRELQNRFDFRVSKAAAAVEYRMKLYEQVLRGVDGLFAHSAGVTRSEFHDYAARLQLDKYFPGIQGIGYAQIIPAAQKDQHVAAMHKQGFPDYTIKPGGEREIYTSVIYLEPFSGTNLNAFGYDMYSDLAHPRDGDAAPGVRRAAMEKARDSGTAAISDKVKLMMETDTNIQAGFLMYLPIYKKGSLHDTVPERRANIIGWAYAPFRMGDLMNYMLAGHINELSIEIHSGKEISDNALLYRSRNGLNSDKSQDALLKTVKHIEVGGHIWSMTFRSLPNLEAKSGWVKANIIANVGISLLLALITWLLVSGRERAINTARIMNRELIKSEASLRTLIDTASEGIWVVDANKKTVKVNRALLDILGASEQDMLSKSICEFICKEHCTSSQSSFSSADWPNAEQHFETLLKRGDGREIYCQFNTAKIRDEKGDEIGSFALVTDITERKHAEQALLASRNQMESLSMFLQSALENERKRIARELHDELGQTMTALNFDLKWLDENIQTPESHIHNKLISMKKLVGKTVDSIRRISEDLRPGMLDDLGLAAAIEHHVVKFAERSGIQCELFMNDADLELDEQIATALFRIVQESLTNVARHSGATQVTIRLQKLENQVLLIVQDNGRGLPASQDADKKTYGLLGMRERVKMLGGTLDVFNEAGAGARIEACVPMHVKR